MSVEQAETTSSESNTRSEQNHNAHNATFSQLSGTAATSSTQPDRFEQSSVNRPSQRSNRGNLPPPTHEDLDTIIENCRRGRISKTSATKDLLESVERLTHLPANTREETFVSYLAEVSSIDREVIERGPVGGLVPGTNLAFGSGSRETQTDVEQRDDFEAQETPPVREETITDRVIRNLIKRPAVQENTDDGNNSGPKRQRLGQSDMPWYGSTRRSELIDRIASCTHTCGLLELYGEDIPRSKFLIRTTLYSPKSIQASQWERILRGESLNLNHFLSSIVRTQIDEDRKTRIGETHLTFTTSKAKRKVRNAADWASAWRQASEAIIFAFPHRREELEQYQRHIQVEFDARQPLAHQ